MNTNPTTGLHRFTYRDHWTANLDAADALGLTAEQYDSIVDEFCSLPRRVGTNRVQGLIAERLRKMTPDTYDDVSPSMAAARCADDLGIRGQIWDGDYLASYGH